MSKEEENIEQQIADLEQDVENSKKEEDIKSKDSNKPEPEEETYWE